MSSDLHDLALVGFGVVIGVCITTQAQNDRTVHIIDHDETAVNREEMR